MKSKCLILIGLLMTRLAGGQSLPPEDIYQRLLPSVVTLTVENAAGEKFVASAFLALGDGMAVTSWHVISDAARVSAKFSDGQTVEVSGVIDRDERHDLALIKLGAANGAQVRLCTKNPRVGARAYVIGAPKGFEFSITDGLISQIQSVDGFDQYQVSCPISAGNSGGPVVNERGEVVGVASWTKRDAQGLSFATPASFLSSLNPARAATPFNLQAVAQAPAAGTARQVRDASQPVEASPAFAALKRRMDSPAGREVTIRDSGAGR